MTSPDEYEVKIAELEQRIEEMERSSSVGLGFFLGILSYYQWGSWVLSFGVAAVDSFVSWKYFR